MRWLVIPCLFAVFGTLLASRTCAQTVEVHIGRKESAAVIGLDEQLSAMPLRRGRMMVKPNGKPNQNTQPANDLVLRIDIAWVKPTKSDGKGFRAAHVSGTDVTRTTNWLRIAMEGEEHAAVGDVAKLQTEATPRVRLEFPQPKTGRSKARQFRHVRRFVEAVLDDLELLAEQSQPWPKGFPSTPALCLYDAEGVGGSGCENLERVVGATTLTRRLLPVCPEDIRDGGLRGMAAVIFPGGSGGGIAKALRPEGVAAVRQFVAGGGGYVGICAGAYFAGSGLRSYAALLPWHHTQPWAKGSAELEVELTPEGRRLLGDEFAKFRTRYHNGPVYRDVLKQSLTAGSKTRPLVLATFVSAAKKKEGGEHKHMLGTPAIAADRFGAGRVVVISPHPESHAALNVLVARSIGWVLDLPRTAVGSR